MAEFFSVVLVGGARFFFAFPCICQIFSVPLQPQRLNNATKMTNNSNILTQIQTLGKKVLPKGSSLLLYGSRARGDNREDSDYDLVVLVDKDKQQLQDFTDYAYPFMEMGWELGAEINPMLYTRKEWNQRHFTPFYKNVEHDKIVLV